MTNKEVAAKVIRIAATITGLIVMWQAVRFCQGQITAPGVVLIFTVVSDIVGAPITTADTTNPLQWIAGALKLTFHYLGGIAIWICLGALVLSLGSSLARIVEIGFKQYMAECKDAQEEARRLAKIDADRERRRELRRKRREALQPKASFGFGSLLLGILIGKIL